MKAFFKKIKSWGLLVPAISGIYFSCASPGDKFNEEFLSQSVDMDAGAYIFLDSSKVILKGNLSYSVTVHRIIKIIDESFINYLANSEVTYSKNEEKFSLIKARTIKPDGKIIKINRKHIVESHKYYDYPAYDDLMAVKFSYSNVEKGDILELIYRVDCSNRYMGGYFDYAKILGGYYPTLKSELIITYPASVGLKNRVVSRGINVKYKKDIVDGNVTEMFSTHDTPGYQFETAMPAYSDVGPHVILSTYSDWMEVAGWYKKLLSKNSYYVSSEMKSLVDKLKKISSGNKLKLARLLYRFVVKKVRYVGVWFGEGEVKPRRADVVFNNLYGDCKDKATLLIALMREAGIEAWPVLVSSRGVAKYFDDFPAMIFNHAITKFKIDGKSFYVDSTPRMGVFDYLPDEIQGRLALEITENPSFLTIPLLPACKSGSDYFFELDLDDTGGLSGKLIIKFRGESSVSFRNSIYGLKKDELKQKIKRVLLSVVPGIRVRKISFKNLKAVIDPAEVHVTFLSDKYFERVDDLLIIPAGLVLFKRPDLVVSKTRAFPMEFWTYWSNIIEFHYKFPANYIIRNVPENTKIKNDYFSYSLDVTNNIDSLTTREKFSPAKLIIEPQEYLVFKRDYDKLLLLDKKYLVLKKK